MTEVERLGRFHGAGAHEKAEGEADGGPGAESHKMNGPERHGHGGNGETEKLQSSAHTQVLQKEAANHGTAAKPAESHGKGQRSF
jgi:hypothetical protein